MFNQAQQQQAIQTSVVLRLSQFNVDPKNLKFGITSFESDRQISIKELDAQGKPQLATIDVQTQQVNRKTIRADMALSHPEQNILALSAKKQDNPNMSIVQVYNMANKSKIKHIEIDNVIYWKWINSQILGLVTGSSVYHLNIENSNENEVKIMDRSNNLMNSQIVGYQVDPQQKWAVLYGISTPDGGKTINGNIQLYLMENQKHQNLEGHCACFGEAIIHDVTTKDQHSVLLAFVEKKPNDFTNKLIITEISQIKEGTNKFKKSVEIQYEQGNDFPIYMQFSKLYGLLYVVTKLGQLLVYEITSCQKIYSQKLCQSIIFVGCKNSQNDGMYLINKEGNVMSCSVNAQGLIPHLLGSCQMIPDIQNLCFKMASRYNLPGVDQLFIDQYNNAMQQNNIQLAAQIIANSPGTLLRNEKTIQQFKNMKTSTGQQAIQVLFQMLLQKGKLNRIESIELCRPVLMQNRKQLVEQWLNDDVLECSDELADLVKQSDKQMAIRMYQKMDNQQKLQQLYMETGQLDKLMNNNNTGNTNVNYMSMIQQLIQSQQYESALSSAQQIYKKNPGMIQVHTVAEYFMQAGRLQEMTGFLVECMKANKSEDSIWQTRVLEQNLLIAPQVAEAILQMNIWSQYDRYKIAQLCEQKMLFQRALENYTDIKDIKRIIVNAGQMNQQWLTNFVGNLEGDWILQCIGDMMKHNRQNVQVCVQICQQQFQKLNISSVVGIFEGISAFDGIFYFLGSIINNTSDKDIHYKYIESAIRCNQFQEVERIISEKQDCYDPEQVKDLLKQQKLINPKSLILLCDKFGYIEELTKYLYQNCDKRFIELYLSKVNPNASPQVLGSLIDLECDEQYIKQLLFNLRGLCPPEETVSQFEKRNKLRVLEKWLENMLSMGNQMACIHNAIAKLKIDNNQNPQEFLVQNQFYDSKVVGQFCEERDPHLAYLAYKRAWGQCDQELIELTNKNQMYRLQARYLVERQDMELWAQILNDQNENRQQIVDQIVSQALPECKNVEEVVCTVQAFIQAQQSQDLINLLERIVLHNSEFGSYKKLQNLLIITSIKNQPDKVMDYIKRLNNYDGQEIAEIAIDDQYALYEEGLYIYNKFEMHREALNVILQKLDSLPRGQEFADKLNKKELYSILGQQYLNKNMIAESIEQYIKAGDINQYLQIIYLGEQQQLFAQLVSYLLLAREQIKDQQIDNSLAYCYSMLNKTTELEDILNNPNSVDVIKVGDRCYDNQLYEQARILYCKSQNNSKICQCHLKLKQFQKAIEFAKRANLSKTWKEVCMICVEEQEYKLAAVAGLEVIVIADMLEDLIQFYEEMGVYEEIIMLLQNGVALNKQNQKGIVTELGILFAKYQSEKLMEHCKMHFNNINVSKMLNICYKYALWNEAVYLHSNYDEYDKAVEIQIDHSPVAFNHTQFISLLQKVSNSNLFKKAILFYLEEQPMQLNDLLKNIHNRLDLSQTVQLLQSTNYIELVLPFLKQVQINNNQQVNETLNNIYLEQEDYESLQKSIRQYDQFDSQKLALQIQGHDVVELRRIAAYLFRKIQKYEQSIQLSLQDKTYRDAIETALESQKPDLVEKLLKFFIQNNIKEYFTVCTYTCYELIKPDQILEFAWRYNMMDYAMPFLIQITKELTTRVDHVQKKHEEKEKKEKKEQENLEDKPLEGFNQFMDPLGGQLMLTNQPMMNQQTMSMGMNSTMGSNMGASNMGGMNMMMQQQQPQQNQFFTNF